LRCRSQAAVVDSRLDSTRPLLRVRPLRLYMRVACMHLITGVAVVRCPMLLKAPESLCPVLRIRHPVALAAGVVKVTTRIVAFVGARLRILSLVRHADALPGAVVRDSRVCAVCILVVFNIPVLAINTVAPRVVDSVAQVHRFPPEVIVHKVICESPVTVHGPEVAGGACVGAHGAVPRVPVVIRVKFVFIAPVEELGALLTGVMSMQVP